MLKRIRIIGFKSLADVEVHLESLVVLFGPNAAGKSNFLDALQLLSRIALKRTLKEAFEPPYRGKPLESFHFNESSLKGLVKQERLAFSIEVDLALSDEIVEGVNQQIRAMRQLGNGAGRGPDGLNAVQVRERRLRYRIRNRDVTPNRRSTCCR